MSLTPEPAAPAPLTAPSPSHSSSEPTPLEQAGQALLAAAQAGAEAHQVSWTSAHLEWSQAGSQHSGRAYLITPGTPVRLDLPDRAVAALARLRQDDARPDVGTWFSIYLTLAPGESEVSAQMSWQQRPYWNAPGLRMLLEGNEAPPATPVPSDEQWLAELRLHPRSPDQVPQWLRESRALPGAAFSELRRRLAEVDYPQEAVLLPGEQPTSATLEGAMQIVASGGRFGVGVRDYGVFEQLHLAPSERAACDWLWEYLAAPLPTPTAVPRYDLDQRSAAYRPVYAQLFAQLQAGGGALLTTLAPGVALDRVGALDGVFLFPWATPMPARSLPTSTSSNVTLYQLVTTQPLTVEAEIVPPWFDQPGGSLRFRLAQDGVGVRQLVQSGALLAVSVGA